jgi:hypothetical protein
MGNSGSTDTATLAFSFAGANNARTWEIKATQIPCGANYRYDTFTLKIYLGKHETPQK